MTRALKNCPFCGNAAAWCDEHHKDEPHECHHIVCTACDAQFDMSGSHNPETLDELKDYCAKLFNNRAEQASQPQWQSIETAPKDGTQILLYAPQYLGVGERVTAGAWYEWPESEEEDAGAVWESWDGGFLDECPPTHWMPLPAAHKNAVKLEI